MNDLAYNIPKDEPIQGRKYYKYKIPSHLNPQEAIQNAAAKCMHNLQKCLILIELYE